MCLNEHKTKNVKYSILILGFLFSSVLNAQTGSIKGKVYNPDNIENSGYSIVEITVENSFFSVGTDSLGHFSMDNIPVGTYDINISSGFYADTTLQNISIIEDSEIHINLVFPPTCPYKKEIHDCPKCGKKDEVIPIVYGQITDKRITDSENGNTLFIPDQVPLCDPFWFCKRDSYKY